MNVPPLIWRPEVALAIKTRRLLDDNTSIIGQHPYATQLAIAEALQKIEEAPTINAQATGIIRTLKLFSSFFSLSYLRHPAIGVESIFFSDYVNNVAFVLI